MQKSISSILIVFIFTFATGSAIRAGEILPQLQSVLATAPADEPIPVIIRLVDAIELKEYKDPDKAFRRSKLIKALKTKTDDSQKSLKKFLKDNGIKAKDVTVLWIINGVAVTVPAGLVERIANRADVESVALDAEVAEPAGSPAGLASPEWNIAMIRAPELWEQGHDGTGIVVAVMDSGVDYDHPDLGPRWRGGTNSWFDPNRQHATPYDSSGHGTWATGLLLAGDSSGTTIGAAPGAQWIAVKIYDDRGRSRLSRIHQGFQYVLDPDKNPDSNDAADVVNNSWYLQNTVDECNTEFADDIAVLRASEIAVVFSAGNTGPYAASSVSPSNNNGSTAVGAVDNSGYIASISGRGPSACSGTVYPQLVAPGVSVWTTDRTFGGALPNSYTSVSGTSFAAPHVSGAMALLLGALPGVTVAEVEAALQATAFDLGAAGADNDSGYGLIDVMEAYLALAGEPAAPVALNDAYVGIENTIFEQTAPGVLTNDTDANGDPLTAQLSTTTANGLLTLHGDGSFEYLPDPGFTGTDSFSYTASDGQLNSNTATVTITVNPLPVNTAPVANGDTAVTIEGHPVTIEVLANDTDGDGDALSVSTVSQPANGAVTNNGADLTYRPNDGFTGTDSFSYTASDGELDSNVATVTVTVEPMPANIAPVAIDDAATVGRNSGPTSIDVTANDYDPDGSIDLTTVRLVTAPSQGGTATVNSDGTISYRPKRGFRGSETFTYVVNDNEGASSNPATVTVEVTK